MKLELKDMQMSKGVVIQKSDGNDDLKHDENILNPTSFALIIKRNLSSAWYKEIPELDISGRLKSIVVSVQSILLIYCWKFYTKLRLFHFYSSNV